jgi:3-hydroxypropanoate dehydrogenase
MYNQTESPNLAAIKTPISQEALDQLFREARTHSAWLPEPVPVELLREAYELARLGPTSANGSPARFVFLTTPKAKARLKTVLAPGNVDKTMAAPATAIIAWDTEFHENLPKLFPQADMRSYFVGNKPLIEENAFRNSSMQAAYFILAARALGLDCGPMSGFDAGKLNTEFFPDGKWKVNLLCNLGYGDPSKLYPRNPRLNFQEATVIL